MNTFLTTIVAGVSACFISFSSSAQVTPGSYTIGGGLNFFYNQGPSNQSSIQNRYGGFLLSPSFGKFVSEKYLIEGGLNYGYGGTYLDASTFTSRSRSNTFGLSFGVTRFIPLSERFYFTAAGILTPGYTSYSGETESLGLYAESESSNITADLNLDLGFAYFVNPRLMLFAKTGAVRYRMTYDPDIKATGHSLGSNLSSNSFQIGARFILGLKNKE